MKQIEEFKAWLDTENVKYRVADDIGKNLYFILGPIKASRHKKNVVMALERKGDFNLYCTLANFKSASKRPALLEAINSLNFNSNLSPLICFYMDKDGNIRARQNHGSLDPHRTPDAAELIAWLRVFTNECDNAIDEIDKALQQKPISEESGYLTMDPFADTNDA